MILFIETDIAYFDQHFILQPESQNTETAESPIEVTIPVSIIITDNTLVDGDREFTLTLSLSFFTNTDVTEEATNVPTGEPTQAPAVLVEPTTATVTIENNDHSEYFLNFARKLLIIGTQ